MKHLLLLAALCATVIFSNCKKDKDPDPVVPKTPQELIVGKWNVTKFINGGANIIQETDEFKIAVELNITSGGTMTFSIIGTDKTVTPPESDTEIANATYTWSGDILTITIVDTDDGLTYSVTGTVSVTTQKFIFTTTSGDEDYFFSLLEADKI